jgi:pyridoxal phosphate enzyme (YggS family)
MTVTDRRAELAENLAVLEERLRAACTASGRARDELTLVAVTKTYPASDIALLAELGVTDIGENRDQEAAAKQQECADLGLRWHFVGQLQRNKCRSVARYADVVHSLDRPEIVPALGHGAVAAGRVVAAAVQVSLAGAGGSALRSVPGRAGVDPDAATELAEMVATTEGLRLAGVMAVAPLGADPEPAFALLAGVAERVRQRFPEATMVSAGMTGDLEAAIAHGATHVRIGTALLGRRSEAVR